MATLSTIEIAPNIPARATVIWLHGLGADGHDFEPIVPELHLPPALAVRFVFPHAPLQPITINQGYVMRAWYDVAGLDLSQTEDAEGIEASASLLRELMERERQRGIPAERIVLAGFSQGGAMALHTGLRYPQRLAGMLALSAYLPLAARFAQAAHPANAGTPLMMAHGTRDPVIPIRLGEASRDLLQRLGYRVAWHTYPMEHRVCPEEIADIAAWLTAVLA
jgi:phospholipase/carboxylesterase